MGALLGRGEALLTFVAARMPRRVAELQVYLAVLAGLGAAAAVAGCLVGLEVDLGAERMGELLSTAAALLTQEVLLPEVLTQISIVADRVSAGALSAHHPTSGLCPACSGCPRDRPTLSRSHL